MTPVYRFLGLTVGTVVQGIPPDARRQAYACDITYCTNKDLAFDYLRDRVALANNGGRLSMAVDALRSGEPTAARFILCHRRRS
jgi:preprotein translocase subunit SecA